jgi:hypothetical protein
MSFEWSRIHKWEDNLYSYASDWVEEYVLDYYNAESIEDLTEDQIAELDEFRENELNEYSPLQAGFSNLINWWESQ